MTDDRIMEEVRDGRVEKLAILFERHHVALFNFFVRMTGNPAVSEDLVQDVFTRILKYRATYRGQDRYSVWMYKIARNAHIDHFRRTRPTVNIEDQYDEAPSLEIAPEERMVKEEEASIVAKALAKLSPKKQEILVLSRFQNLKYREIAEVLDCPVGTVKGLVHRAVRELGEIYASLTQDRCNHEV